MHATILVTVHPDQLASEVLATVEIVAAVGDAPASTIRQFCAGLGEPPPPLPADDRIEAGEALLWERSSDRGPVRFEVVQPRTAAPPPCPQVQRGRARRGSQLLFPRPRRRALPARSEPLPVPADRGRGRRSDLAVPPARRATTRPGSATRSRTRISPTRLPRSNVIANSTESIAGRGSRRRSTGATPGRRRRHPAGREARSSET